MRQGFDVLEGSIEVGAFDLIVSPQEERWLEMRGFFPNTISVGAPVQRHPGGPTGASGSRHGSPGYSDLAEILSRTEAVAIAHPSICQYVNLTQKYAGSPGVPTTFEGP